MEKVFNVEDMRERMLLILSHCRIIMEGAVNLESLSIDRLSETKERQKNMLKLGGKFSLRIDFIVFCLKPSVIFFIYFLRPFIGY